MRLPVVCLLGLLNQLPVFSQAPARYDVIIHEILPKPTPEVGLPAFEYIELKNRGSKAWDLAGWKLGVNKREVQLPAYQLKPDSLVVLCSTAAAAAYNQPGIIGVPKFPPLADDTALITLYGPEAQVIHGIYYTQGWYGGPIKGGRSLEMVDPSHPCTETDNWLLSPDPAGGTPGKPNAAAKRLEDDSRPDLLFATLADSQQVSLHFSKPVDSSIAANPERYRLPGFNILAVKVLQPIFNEVALQLHKPLNPDSIYIITVNGIRDCEGKESGLFLSAAIGKSEPPGPKDIVINELLFYTSAGVPEFIEILNASTKRRTADKLFFSSRKKDGSFGPFKALTQQARIIEPGEHLAFTTSPQALCRRFSCLAPNQVLRVGSLPSMPLEAGSIVLVTADSSIIDEVHYSDSMHFALFNTNRDISLERKSPNLPSDDMGNWHSAAGTYGGASPGFQNTQRQEAAVNTINIVLSPEVISPDNGGVENRAILSWKLPLAGYTGNIQIFDASGKLVKRLSDNLLMGTEGSVSWNATNEYGELLPSGIYIFLIEIFNLQGEVKRWKKTIVVARKLT
jgi:hypothetical protein